MRNSEIEILLVEDNMGDADLTIRALRRENLANKLVHLENGADALDYIFAEGVYTDRNHHNLPQIILLDLNMPKVNGIEVLERVKADERTKKIPVIVLTGDRDQRLKHQLLQEGADAFLLKPIHYEDLLAVIRSFVEIRSLDVEGELQ